MTHERDLQPLLNEWFADGPDRAPDRVLDVVIDRLERQGQRPAWRRFGRLRTMNSTLKLAMAIAAVVIVAVIGYNVLPAGPNQVGGQAPMATASATPGPTFSPTPTAPDLPDGLLAAGDYVARAVRGDTMAFTITVPSGWTGYGGFFIGGPQNSSAPSGIGISFNHDPDVVTDPCDGSTHTPSPASSSPTVDDLVAALSAREDLNVSGVTDTVLAGFSGKRLDLQLPATSTCPGNHYVFAEPKGLYSNGPSNRWRVWLLDVDGETAVVVLLDYAATPAEYRNAAMAAIDSIRITP